MRLSSRHFPTRLIISTSLTPREATRAGEKWLKAAAQVTLRDPAVPYQLALIYRNLGRQDDARASFALSSELRRRDHDDSRIKLER
jgi:hypothetical protein